MTEAKAIKPKAPRQRKAKQLTTEEINKQVNGLDLKQLIDLKKFVSDAIAIRKKSLQDQLDLISE
jgi:ribosomal protein S18